jgi:hypothetical protein
VPQKVIARSLASWILLTSTIGLFSAYARAMPLPCRPDQAIYKAIVDDKYEIEFFKDFNSHPQIEKTGILRHRGTKPIALQFSTNWSLGFTRPYMHVELPKAAREGDDGEEGISSVILTFDPDFRPPRADKWAAPYIVLPDLGRGFHYGSKLKIVPPEAWKLSRCRSVQ